MQAPIAYHPHDRLTGIILTLISGLAFSTLPVFNRIASTTGANLVTILGLRFVIAAVIVWLLVLRQGNWRVSRQQAIGLCSVGALYVVQASCFFVSSVRIPVAVTSILLYLYPVIVTVLARIFFRDALDKRKVLSLLLALSGCVLTLGAPQVGGDWVGIGFGLLSAVLYSIYIIISSRVQRGIPALTASAYIMTSAGVIFMLFGIASGQLSLNINISAWVSIVGLALVCTVVAVMLFLAGMQRIGPAQASIVSTIEPVGTALLGALLLSEGLGVLQVLGGVLVIGAVVLVSLRARSVA
jgi:drug/metabolite transporter (DMT)-like permease